MAKKTALTVTLHIDGVRETLAAFRRLGKDAEKKLREASLRLADVLAAKAQAAARTDSAQSALMAPTVKAVRDRVPTVQAGGTRKVGRNRAPAWGVLFGSEFGMNQRSGWYANPRYDGESGRQYRPHQGRQGYWFFPLVEENAGEIADAWNKAAGDLLREFEAGDG